MDQAPHVFADTSLQSNAARRLLLRAAHDGVMSGQLRREVRGRGAARGGMGFAPMERDPEMSAASTARDARVRHAARDYTVCASSR